MNTWNLALFLPFALNPVLGPLSGTWAQKNAIGSTPTSVLEFIPRFGAGGFAIGNVGYVMGGNSSSRLLNDLWSYDPVTSVWAQRSDLPAIGRANMASL